MYFFLTHCPALYRKDPMNLIIWLPALFLLGLVTMALLFSFLIGCEKV